MTSIDSEELNVILYRYSPDNNKYEGASFSKLDPISQRPLPIAYSTDIKPSIEPSFGESLYFIDNEWIIKDDYIDGIFYDISNGEKQTKIKVKDASSYTDVEPNLIIKEGEQIAYIDNEWQYTYRIPPTIEEVKDRKILELKIEGSRRIQTIDGRHYDDISWLRKSQNYQDTIARLLPRSYYETLSQTEDIKLREAVSVINRKDRYVQRINEVEEQIISMESIEQVNAINVTSDELWSGLDG